MAKLNIPVGVSDFAELRSNGYYYVDKSGLIREMLTSSAAKVTLITRPRRFGKTLGMSMLENFFNIRKNSEKLFENLEISGNRELCDQWMNQWPVIFFSLKDIDGLDFQSAYDRLVVQLSNLCKMHVYLLQSEAIDPDDKKVFLELKAGTASEAQVGFSLNTLMRMMESYYRKPVILLLDEYDVPLAKASSNGYYKEMLSVIKGMMSTALKDNPFLKFAIITGCLKIAKESIFTGTNNLVSDTITDTRLNEYFGFIQKDVEQILRDAGSIDHLERVKSWYDGYSFEKEKSIYSPRSVVNCMRFEKIENYWNQTETFEALQFYIDMNFDGLKDDVLSMIAGEKVPVNTGSFTNDMTTFRTEDDVLTLLIHLGYLGYDSNEKCVFIPNNEIRSEYVNAVSVSDWGEVSQALKNSADILNAIWQRRPEQVAEGIRQAHFETSHIQYNDENALSYTISLALYAARNFYTVHRELAGGKGFADMVYIPRKKYPEKPALVVELKWDKSAAGAISQIKEKEYCQSLEEYQGNLLLVGINYDVKTKEHSCVIEEFVK